MTAQELRQLGWKWFRFSPTLVGSSPWVVLAMPAEWQALHGGVRYDPQPTDERDTESVSRYSTDPSAAMMVLERLLDGGSKLQVWKGVSECGKLKYCVAEKQNRIYEDAETLPLAICLFAKALFGKEKERRENKNEN